ncbi:MAG: peptidoglycan DD-metalloendopeptidase family protein [Clostridiaceae bacterium]
MKNKIISIATALILTTSINVFGAETADSYQDKIENNNKIINELENSKDELQSKKNQVNGDLNKVLDTINELSGEVNTLNSNISAKESMITTKENDIKAMEEKITVLETNISAKLTEIKVQEDELAYQENVLSERVRAAYKYNSVNNVVFTLIESKSIVDFTERLIFIEKMAAKDREVMDLIDSIIKDLDEKKSALENDMKESQDTKVKLNSEKTALVNEKSSLESQKNSLQSKLENQKDLEFEKKSVYNSLTEEEKNIADEIGDIMQENEQIEASIQKMIREAQEAARKKKEAAAAAAAKNNTTTSNTSGSNQSSGYIRPVAGRISSPYGYRIHPVTGKPNLHGGVDFAAAYGTGIKATRAGEIIVKTYNSSYGNYIIIDHGNGIASLYAHMSGFNASIGQEVSQGSIIGFVGSTGSSTGPHLHFEIRVNGTRVDPMNYLN